MIIPIQKLNENEMIIPIQKLKWNKDANYLEGKGQDLGLGSDSHSYPDQIKVKGINETLIFYSFDTHTLQKEYDLKENNDKYRHNDFNLILVLKSD